MVHKNVRHNFFFKLPFDKQHLTGGQPPPTHSLRLLRLKSTSAEVHIGILDQEPNGDDHSDLKITTHIFKTVSSLQHSQCRTFTTNSDEKESTAGRSWSDVGVNVGLSVKLSDTAPRSEGGRWFLKLSDCLTSSSDGGLLHLNFDCEQINTISPSAPVLKKWESVFFFFCPFVTVFVSFVTSVSKLCHFFLFHFVTHASCRLSNTVVGRVEARSSRTFLP